MISKCLHTLLYTCTSIFVVLGISWVILIQCNFFYSFWHQHGGIGETVEYFATINQHISNFELTTLAERDTLFKEISHAVHFSADSLKEIQFSVMGASQYLLHDREVTHLKDVANVINVLFFVIFLSFIAWCYLLYQTINSQQKLPSIGTQSIIILSLLTVLTLLTVSIGATDVFYWLHEVIFPDNHQWFFYYEDSLMSTLMSAPDLFGWIAIEWLILFIVTFYFVHLSVAKIISMVSHTKG